MTPRRPNLTLELIVDTACELISESHAEQLTMRRLSQRLGVALGATYHHVADRTALLVLVAHRINDSIELRSARPNDWAATVRSLMIDYAEAYARYPGMGAFSISHLAATRPDASHLDVVRLLVDAGFDERSADDVLTAFFFYTAGATASDVVARDQPGYAAGDLMRRFDEGLDLLIEGAQVRLRADRKRRRQTV